MSAYHTALKGGTLEQAQPAYRAEFPDGIALQHDLWEPLPLEFACCDVLYADPPWRTGYNEFNRRADSTDGRTWRQFEARLIELCMDSPVPIVLVAGKEARSRHEEAGAYSTRLNGNEAVAICYGIELNDTVDSTTILHELAERFACIGDPMCGYGRTGAIAREHGKRFVLSDHNAQCIGYVAERLGNA